MKGAAGVKGKQARLITSNTSGKYIFHDWTDFKRGSLCNSKSYMIEVALFFSDFG